MDLSKFKVKQMQRQASKKKMVIPDGVAFDLKNLIVVSTSEFAAGSAYTCTLAPKTGYYLPQVISVGGTNSAYGFKYDYTTGVVYIPSDEVIGNIVIAAEASKTETNVPAVFEVTKITATTYDGTTEYADETFILLDIYPCRGSTVTVKFKGNENGEEVIKTVTGDLATEQYETGTPCTIFFGTYLGQTEETTSASGVIEISGAYEGYGAGTYEKYNSKGNNVGYAGGEITKITEIGCPRYFGPYAFSANGFSALDIGNKLNEGLEKINDYVFYKRTGFQFEKLPDVVYIGEDAFAGTDVNFTKIPDTVEKIGTNAFLGCPNFIGPCEMPNNPVELSSCMFNAISFEELGLTPIKGVIFPKNFDAVVSDVPEIETPSQQIVYAVAFSKELETVSVAEENPRYHSVDDAIMVETASNTLVFGGNKADGMELPPYIEFVENYAFSFRSGLYTIGLGNVSAIGEMAFYGCENLQSVVIPASVVSIGKGAFAVCSALATVTVEAETPPALDITTEEDGTVSGLPFSESEDNAFAAIYVPKGCGDTYKAAAGWCEYADKIVEVTE